MQTPTLGTTPEFLKKRAGCFTVFFTNTEGDLKSKKFKTRPLAQKFIDAFPASAGFLPVPTTPEEDFKTITSSIAKVLTEKNKRYGNSALNPVNVFNGKSKVGQRADDKLSRIANSPTLRKNDVADLLGYLVLICKENNWMDFQDQID